MTSTYREIQPSPHLAAFIECFWTSEISAPHQRQILPDGCADIIFFTRGSQLIQADVVGVMTRPHLVSLEPGLTLLCVRFHPGMAGACLPCDIPSLNNKAVGLQTILGAASDRLTRGLFSHTSVERRVESLEDRLVCSSSMTQVQQAIGTLVGKRGELSLEDFAVAAGVGERQLRRACLKHSGLAPKQLARILRFRKAAAMIRAEARNMAAVAQECGYFDQSHMIRDFCELAGMSPTKYVGQLKR